jgi:hypothetical protein
MAHLGQRPRARILHLITLRVKATIPLPTLPAQVLQAYRMGSP